MGKDRIKASVGGGAVQKVGRGVWLSLRCYDGRRMGLHCGEGGLAMCKTETNGAGGPQEVF